MTRRDGIELRDDLDGSVAHHVVEFSYRGRAYEIDLSTDNAEAFYNAIEPYIEAARPIEYRNPRTSPALPAPSEIRRWAVENGISVSQQGRIAHRVRAAYAAAHRDVR